MNRCVMAREWLSRSRFAADPTRICSLTQVRFSFVPAECLCAWPASASAAIGNISVTVAK